MMKTSNFLIIGAAKAGTTSLYYYLNQHPEVYMSEPKEPFFFEAEYDKGIEYYWSKYFAGWRGEKAIGEARHRNLYLPYVVPRIKESIPNAKLIVILRNPIDRAYSHWWHWYSRGEEPLSFEDAIYEDLKRIEKGITFEGEEGAQLWCRNFDFKTGKNEFRTYLDSGYYARQLKRYLALFPKSQIKVVFLEDLKRDPQFIISELWEFIGVDPNYPLKDLTLQNPARSKATLLASKIAKITKLHKIIPKQMKHKLLTHLAKIGKRPEMNKETRAWLINHYYPHNRELEKLVGRDLSHWDK